MLDAFHMAEIPNQLVDWRFILLVKGQKIPMAEMKGWTEDRAKKTYAYSDPRLIKWIEEGGNYGVCSDTEHIILACDTLEIEKAIEERLPKTFSVKSPRHKTKHFYFNCKTTDFVVFKPTVNGDPCCDLRRGNSYVLGAGSSFETYGKYEVVDNDPIATITENQILSYLDEFIVKKKILLRKTIDQAEHLEHQFPIIKILNPFIDNMSHNGNEIFGAHIKHGSTTGNNFHVNLERNIWHCFRHNTGGSSLELFAVIEGLLNCEDCRKGSLRGELFKKVVNLAYEKKYLAEKPLFKKEENQFITLEGNQLKPNTEAILNFFKTKYQFITTNDTEEIYYYREGEYIEAELMIKHSLEEMLYTVLTTHYTNEIIDHLKRSKYIEREKINQFKGRIPILNGLLDLRTYDVIKFNPEEIYTFKLNMKFDPTKNAPLFHKYLDSAIPEEDKQKLLQEYCGYCLLPDMPFAKILLNFGEGRNGKDRIIITLEHILGENNVSHVPLEELDGSHRFSVANLCGRLLNVCSEPSTEKPLTTEIIKRMTGESMFDAEKKNIQKPLKFRGFSKFIIEGNKYPQLNDDTIAMKERLAIIKWEKQFLEGDPNTIPHIERTWLGSEDEISGILNWLLIGLRRLLENKAFTTTVELEEIFTEYEKMSDPKRSFIKERTVKNPTGKITGKELYDLYKDYCSTLKVTPDSDTKLYNHINTIPGVKKTRETEGTMFSGLSIISISNINVENVENVINIENKKKYISKENFLKDRNTSFSTFSTLSTLLDSFESYMEIGRSVGVFRVLEDLQITEDVLRLLMATPGCKVSWGMDRKTLDFNPKKEGKYFWT